MIAQAPTTPEVPADFFSNIQNLHLPDQTTYLQQLTGMHPIQACLLLACGVVYLVYGWKLFKILVVANFATIGIFAGHHLGALAEGSNANMPLIAAIAGGLVVAVLAWPLMKYGIAVMGGLAGSFVGYGTWHYIVTAVNRTNLLEYHWVGATIGLITLGLLAFVIFRITVIVFTAFQGSLMALTGGLALLLKSPELSTKINDNFTQNIYLLPLLIGVPAIIGFAVQFFSAPGGKPAPAGGGPKK